MKGIARFIGHSLAKVEKAISRGFSGAATTVTGHTEKGPIEIRQHILREVEERIEARGKGEFFLPFDIVEVELFSSTSERRDAFEAAFEDGRLTREVHALLLSRRCRSTPRIVVRVAEDADLAATQPIHVKWIRKGELPALPRPKAVLTVLQGKAEIAVVPVERDRVFLGRLKDVSDRKVGVVRRNDVAFDNSETTVARRHAMLIWAGETGHFRLVNDSASRTGTTILRGGAVLSCDSIRGVQLQSADEIMMGNARVSFHLLEGEGNLV